MPVRFVRPRSVARALLLPAVAVMMACQGTATATSPIFTTDLVTGTVVTGVPDFHPVTINVASTVTLALSGLVPNTGVAVGVGIGTPPVDGSAGCLLDTAQTLQLGQMFTTSETAGAHCVAVFEFVQNGVGAIPDPLTYTVTFNHH